MIRVYPRLYIYHKKLLKTELVTEGVKRFIAEDVDIHLFQFIHSSAAL